MMRLSVEFDLVPTREDTMQPVPDRLAYAAEVMAVAMRDTGAVIHSLTVEVEDA